MNPLSSVSSTPSVTLSRIRDRKSTRLNSSHLGISYAVFCLKKKTKNNVLLRKQNDDCRQSIKNVKHDAVAMDVEIGNRTEVRDREKYQRERLHAVTRKRLEE